MKDNVRQTLKTISSLLSYAGCILVSYLIMYYLDGTIGVFLISALICAFVLSLVLTLIARKTVRVKIYVDNNALAKGESLNCIAELSNSILLPAPVIEIELYCSAHLDQGDVPLYKGAAGLRSPNKIKIPITAVHCGLAEIRVKRISLSDFLGIFVFGIDFNADENRFTAAVYPDIPDVAVQTDFLKTANSFTSSDDEEEESNESSPIPTGMPGYEHREYMPGDPIKRINWKLSSKKDIYMIRLDEQVRGTGQMFFLDCPVCEDDDNSLKVRDTIIEGALSALSMIVREGRDAHFYFYNDGLWLGSEIHEQGDIYKLQELLARFSPKEPSSLLPEDIINSGKTPICFTAAVKGHEEHPHMIAAQYPDALIVSALSAQLILNDVNHWTISDEFEMTKNSER